MKKGVILILTFIVLVSIVAITLSFLTMVFYRTKGSGYDKLSSQSFWLAEAGLQKAIWNLKTPVASGGRGEDWTTVGTTENLATGSYTMEVERWDWALSAHNATASASSSEAGHDPDNGIDGNDATWWESADKPRPPFYENIVIAFPYRLTINKARFVVPVGASQQRPSSYEWHVSTDGVNFTTVYTDTNNDSLDVTNEFPAQANVNYLRLWVAKTGGGATALGVKVATVEAIGSKITVTAAVDILNRKIEQTVAVDDAGQEAYDQIDWDELPAL
ncbi:MAG: discoidin domain-containing protein [Candidatus Omnitrophota bacterium]